ncbi:metallo-beta-lactamase domain protein [Bordetella bronchiseptica F2]|nr:metallo-beta-lactamase domain protein [Bordetella bronchiseptica MO211]KAK74981.1 metallo-beta-lactamase domain protein [Bordetella bronchiseptica CA90 BB02]KCV49142.1 metallo-beta-lactamase domain protein [Bordetella bronchiseptica 3E44]KCV53504.1 metallo-beta-lactamase domain protein [Bordetella bronchiseptica 7E71]KDB81696.1 metallo-beta-lactamase domain protein [Bordetella bronchiseptica CARE970018BB]KDC30392.1 metallo-beta-lactamase domain protein [Bordetella bronchiseptica F2]KDC3105
MMPDTLPPLFRERRMSAHIQPFFDPATATFSYVLYEAPGGACAVIDPVLDFDPKSGRTTTASADRIADFVRQYALRTQWLLETHAHADHLSAAAYLQRQLGGVIGIGGHIRDVQAVFSKLYNLDGFACDGSQFGHLFEPDETFAIGALRVRALHVPGHTPADLAYLIDDGDSLSAFVGDTLFMPDVGTARCDFPGGDARTLYHSIRTLLALPPDTRLYMCHDYPPAGRAAAWQTTVAAQRAGNIHVRDGISESEFVAMRTARDATLDMPTLILPALQVNIRAGELPAPEANGTRYLRIPLDAL